MYGMDPTLLSEGVTKKKKKRQGAGGIQCFYPVQIICQYGYKKCEQKLLPCCLKPNDKDLINCFISRWGKVDCRDDGQKVEAPAEKEKLRMQRGKKQMYSRWEKNRNEDKRNES